MKCKRIDTNWIVLIMAYGITSMFVFVGINYLNEKLGLLFLCFAICSYFVIIILAYKKSGD